MKTSEEIIHELDTIFDCASSRCELKDASERRLSLLKKHEVEVRNDQKQKDIQSIRAMKSVLAVIKDDAIRAIEEGE